MKKKKSFFLLMAFSLVMIGGAVKPVELLTSQKLIDLELTIKDAPPGYQGNPGTDNTGDSNKESDSTDSDDATSQSNTQIITTTEYTIKITDMSVVFDNITYDMDDEDDVKDLKTAILKRNSYSSRFVIVDAYAEAHTYRKVLELFQQLSESEHVFYSEKMN